MLQGVLPVRRGVAFGVYDLDTDEPQVAVDLTYCRQFVLYEDDAARVIGKLLNGLSVESVLADIRRENPDHADEYTAQTLEFLDEVAPSLFDIPGKPLFFPANAPKAEPRDTTLPGEADLFSLRASEKQRLVQSMCELTYRCQLRCRHCYNPDHRAENDLTTEQWIDALKQLRKAGIFRVTFTGGDPFARSDIWEILETASALHLSFSLFTNGQVLAETENAERLRELYPRAVHCSVYGAKAETHDFVTQVPGSFEKTLRCLRFFRDANVPTALKSPALQCNWRELPEIAKMARELDATHETDMNIIPRLDGSQEPMALRLNDEQMVELSQIPGLPLFSRTERASHEPMPMRSPNQPLCVAGFSNVDIARDGTVLPCLSLAIPLGNLKETPLDEILAGDTLANWRKMHWSQVGGKCVDCEMIPFCTFCPGESLREKGTCLLDNTNGCQIARVQKQVHEILQRRC